GLVGGLSAQRGASRLRGGRVVCPGRRSRAHALAVDPRTTQRHERVRRSAVPGVVDSLTVGAGDAELQPGVRVDLRRCLERRRRAVALLLGTVTVAVGVRAGAVAMMAVVVVRPLDAAIVELATGEVIELHDLEVR